MKDMRIEEATAMKRKSAFASLGMLLLLVLGVASASIQPEALAERTSEGPFLGDPSPKPPSMTEKLASANTQFGFQLFSTIVRNSRDENVFVSPTSVAIALSMLYNGAGSQTQQDMADGLAFQDISLAEINAANQALQASLRQAGEDLQIGLANSLWMRKGFSFNPQFLNANQQFYQAKIAPLDFDSSEAINIINGWVREETRGKIESIIDRIDRSNVMFLINAIYFKGIWTHQFDKSLTQDKPFYTASDRVEPKPMMSRQGKYQYYENSDFQAVRLPYGNGRWSMYVFLPRKDSNLPAFLKQLTPDTWKRWLSEFSNREGLLEMPRFKLEYEINLRESLEALGMGRIFKASQADFSPMTSHPVSVDEVKHKTFVEVNEEGTEAAAVTSIGIRATSALPEREPFSMVVDRPFFCAIGDERTGTVLFMGAMVDP